MRRAPRAAAALLGTMAAAGAQPPAVAAGAGPQSKSASAARTLAPSAVPAGAQAAPKPRAPSGPPLVGPGATAQSEGAEGEDTLDPGGADPLVANGLASPLCRGVVAETELDAASRRHCQTSDFAAAPAPTPNYGIDVHIDTGFLGLGSGGFLSIVQDLVVTPLWMGLVWAVHALVVMLEWALTLDLLDGPAGGGLGSALRRMQAALTIPWLSLALAVAAASTAYAGIVRRRVGDSLAAALSTLAMTAGGMWLIADPTGTLGALGSWANAASLGTLTAAARGQPDGGGGALGSSLETVFATAIEGPWCYLEFGDVAWCQDPERLDPQLRAAGLGVAARLRANGDASSRRSQQLLTEADSNGSVFLALPPNGAARNSINASWSLLQAICRSPQATSCRGPDSSAAEFRTDSGTWPRLGGLLLIAAGLLGMLMLLGFIALRLLAAAVLALLYLLLAPGMVLVPAFGESGRAVFRRWGTHLLAAAVAKLLFSFLLGVILAVDTILSQLSALGWWTQWLLTSAFWWGAYVRRHDALGAAHGAVGRDRRLTRRMRRAASPQRQAHDAVHRYRERRRQRTHQAAVQAVIGGRPRTPEARSPAPSARDAVPSDQRFVARATRAAAADLRWAAGERDAQPEHLGAVESKQAASRCLAGFEPADAEARLVRLRQEAARAAQAGDTRREQSLRGRAQRVRDELAAREPPPPGQGVHDRERAARGLPVAQPTRRLHERAGLPGPRSAPGGRSAAGPDRRRDYEALAGVVDITPAAYRALGAPEQRAARLAIDRELSHRSELRGRLAQQHGGHEEHAQGRSPSPGRDAAASRSTSSTPAAPPSRADPSSAERESAVMRDAREVAARRKRQLGFDRE